MAVVVVQLGLCADNIVVLLGRSLGDICQLLLIGGKLSEWETHLRLLDSRNRLDQNREIGQTLCDAVDADSQV